MSSKLAIITGGGSGLGLSTAKKFCLNGFQTIITGRNISKLNEAASICGEKCIPLQLDMDNRSSFQEWVEKVYMKYGPIDVLVNNAGINQKKPFLDVSDEDFDKIMHTNTLGVFSLSREVVRTMIKEKKGCIVNISSMAALYGIPYVVSYAASKTAITGLTLTMAVELANHNIRVNAVAPGFISTPMTFKALEKDPERKAKVFGRTPMKRMGNPEDIANAVYFLASDDAEYITGEILKVDGGNSIGF